MDEINKELKDEFWELFRECMKKSIGFPYGYRRYKTLIDEPKNKANHFIETLLSKPIDEYDDEENKKFAEKFHETIIKINSKLPESDKITDKDSFFKFAEKTSGLDMEKPSLEEEPIKVEPKVEKAVVTPTETKTDTVKKPSVFKRIGNYFANMSPTSKIANGVAIGLLAASAIFAGPATLLEPVALMIAAIPVISIGGKALYKSFKDGKIRQWINNRKNKNIEFSSDKAEELSKSLSSDKSDDIEEDFFKGFDLPKETEKETIVNPDKVAEEAVETVDEVEREVKKDGYGPRDFILPGTKVSEGSPLEAENIEETVISDDSIDDVNRKVINTRLNKEYSKGKIEMIRQRANYEPTKNRVVQPIVNETSNHVPKHLQKPVDEEKVAKIEQLQSRLKTLNWTKDQLAVNTKIKKSEEEMKQEQRAIEANKQAIKDVKKELRKYGITEEKPLSQVLRAKAKKLALKSEKAVLENKNGEANSYNYVISEINEYLELEKKYKKVSKILGEESLEVVQLKNALDEKAKRVEFISSSVEDAYNFESRRSRK